MNFRPGINIVRTRTVNISLWKLILNVSIEIIINHESSMMIHAIDCVQRIFRISILLFVRRLFPRENIRNFRLFLTRDF